MITIHATKKLLAKLPVDEQGLLPVAHRFDNQQDTDKPSPSGSWHANLLTIQRRNCLLFIHDETRFPVFMPALTKSDFANLNFLFEDALMNTLIKCGANHRHMTHASMTLQSMQFDTVCNRSVQGTLNRTAWEAEHYIHFDGVNVAEITGHRLAAELAGRPCNVKGQKDCIWPKDAFLALLDGLEDSPPATEPDSEPSSLTRSSPELPENVVLLDAFRKPK